MKQQRDRYQEEQIRGIFLISPDSCTREVNTDRRKRKFRDFVEVLIGKGGGVYLQKKLVN